MLVLAECLGGCRAGRGARRVSPAPQPVLPGMQDAGQPPWSRGVPSRDGT